MSDAVLQLELPGRPLSAFVVGPENRLLAPVIQRLIDGGDLAAAASLFNPLVFIGPPGSGKSHLAQALVRQWRRQLAMNELAYFTAADFSRELQAAQGDERLVQWRREIGSLRVFVVEGLERFRRHSTNGRELRQAFDSIIDAGGLVVATADREPASLHNLDAGLRDRLAAGLTLRLAQPGLAARRVMLTLAADSRELSLANHELDQLAEPEASAAAQLIARLDAHADGGVDAVGRARSEVTDSGGEAITLKHILAVAARYFAVTQAAIVSHSRRRTLVTARNAVVYLARRLTRLSYGQIGAGLGNRDHTTIMHAQRRVAECLPHDAELEQTVAELERILRC